LGKKVVDFEDNIKMYLRRMCEAVD